MSRGKPKNGFRMSKKRLAAMGMAPGNWKPSDPAAVAALATSIATAPAAVINPMAAQFMPEPEIPMTDEEISKILEERFEVMDIMTDAVADGTSRALIISGPPGVGKSFNVVRKLDKLAKKGDVVYTQITGFVRATGLYKLLYEYKNKNNVLVFDDADSVFFDDVALNLLKAATDTTKTRTLHWRAETNMEVPGTDSGEKMPTEFDFEGAIVFITNLDFDKLIAQGNKLAPHLTALISRTHYLDLAMKTRRSYFIRIKQVVKQGMLRQRDFSAHEEAVILGYIEKHQDDLRELSLRMVVKIAGLMKMHKNKWESIAMATCFRQGYNRG